MKAMKFFASLLAILITLTCFASCGGSVDETTGNSPDTEISEVTENDTTEKEQTESVESAESDEMTEAPDSSADDSSAEEPTKPDPALEDMKENFKAVADTYVVNDAAKSTDFGSEDRLRVKKDENSQMTRRAFIKFDTSASLLDEVTKATLRIECQYLSKDAAEISGRDVNLYATSSDWAESSFNWSTQPAVTEKIADVDSASFVGYQWVNIDVTDYVKAHLGEAITFSLWNEGIDSEGNYLDFNSREKVNHEPYLFIEGLGIYEEIESKPIVGGGSESWIPVADTYVESKDGNPPDLGSAEEMIVKKADGAKLSRRLYTKFDTSGTTLESVNKATLRLYCTYVSKDANEIPTRDMNLYAVSSDWREGTFTWATQPETIEKVADVESAAFVAWEWIEIDVTEYVKAHIGEVFTFSLWNEGVDSEGNHLNFSTREKEGFEPQLVIE